MLLITPNASKSVPYSLFSDWTTAFFSTYDLLGISNVSLFLKLLQFYHSPTPSCSLNISPSEFSLLQSTAQRTSRIYVLTLMNTHFLPYHQFVLGDFLPNARAPNSAFPYIFQLHPPEWENLYQIHKSKVGSIQIPIRAQSARMNSRN